MPVDVNSGKENYTGSAAQAGARYKKKVMANTNWHDNASSPAAESLWAQAVAAAAAAQRRARAVSAVPQSTWQNQAANVGASRLPQGMTAKADKWAQNFGPYAPVIDAAVSALPPRGIGADANIGRVLAVDKALENQKKQLKG